MLKHLAWLALANTTALLVSDSIIDFRPGGTGVFISQKGPAATPVWVACLYLHVVAGAVCLISSLPQFSRTVLRRFPALHRTCGIAFAISVLLVLCPTGMVLALSAKGGWLGQGGFLLLGAATFFTTSRGVAAVAIGPRNLANHRRWMIRSFAMVTTALSFRVYHLALFQLGLAEMTNYLTSLYLSILGNAAVAEWLVRNRAGARLTPSSRIQPSQTQTSP
jgi:hypothetical protein